MDCNHVVLKLKDYEELIDRAKMGDLLLDEIRSNSRVEVGYSNTKQLNLHVDWPKTIVSILENVILAQYPAAALNKVMLDSSEFWDVGRRPKTEEEVHEQITEFALEDSKEQEILAAFDAESF